jgi:CheY-like chemotaxis protein
MANDHYELSYVVVDDDEDDRMLLRLSLDKASRQLPVLEFADGQAMLDHLTENATARPDRDNHWLVVLDLNMPRMNGLETVRQIRQNPDWANLPVLILSTSDDPEKMRELIANGANGYITKPSSTAQYIDIFDRFFAPWLTPATMKAD